MALLDHHHSFTAANLGGLTSAGSQLRCAAALPLQRGLLLCNLACLLYSVHNGD